MKKLKTLYTITFLAVYHFGFSQNLVPNPSFEDTFYCPAGIAEIDAVKNWYSPNFSSPDYFNSCDNTNYVGVPSNVFGFQEANFGNAYVGIGSAFDNTNLNYREYIQTQLTSTLIQNKKYIVEFYISMCDSSSIALKDIGVVLSSTPIGNSTGKTIIYSPQFVVNQFLTDTNTWVKISDTITAIGNEYYLTIGYFKDNNLTDTMHVRNSLVTYMQSYYYIDDVLVSEDLTEINSQSLNPTTICYYDNGIIHINTDNILNFDLSIYNQYGQLVKKCSLSGGKAYSVDFLNNTKGIYFIKINNNMRILSQKIVINQ